MYSNAKYIKDITGNINTIQVDIDGVTTFVGIDTSNPVYVAIMALVDAGELTIAPADAP